MDYDVVLYLDESASRHAMYGFLNDLAGQEHLPSKVIIVMNDADIPMLQPHYDIEHIKEMRGIELDFRVKVITDDLSREVCIDYGICDCVSPYVVVFQSTKIDKNFSKYIQNKFNSKNFLLLTTHNYFIISRLAHWKFTRVTGDERFDSLDGNILDKIEKIASIQDDSGEAPGARELIIHE